MGHHDVLSPLVDPHHCIIAKIIYEGCSEPLKRLASVFLTAPLSNVERMYCPETNDETPRTNGEERSCRIYSPTAIVYIARKRK